jgi:hypothetical protein
VARSRVPCGLALYVPRSNASSAAVADLTAAEGSYDLRTNSKQQASQQSIWPERAFTNMNPVAIHAQSPEVQCPNCREALRLMRHIHLTGVPNIYVFYCQPCQFVETAAACG